MVQTDGERARGGAALEPRWARRSIVVACALVLLASGCSSSDSINAKPLPQSGAPRLGVAVDAELVGSGDDLAPFDDGMGYGKAAADGFKLGAREPESIVVASLDRSLPPDQIVEAGFTTDFSPLDIGFGVTCRMRDNDNYYRLGVGNDGTFAIARVQDGTSTVLTGAGRWIRDRRLRETPGYFVVRGECRGPTLTLFVNHEHIASVQDPTFDRRGQVGVFVETFAEPHAEITVTGLSARAFRDRSQVTDATAADWDAFVRAQGADRRCKLLDERRARSVRDPLFVTRCGIAVFVRLPGARTATREYDRLIRDAAGTTLERVKQLPDCRDRTGIRGPLPNGEVACLDLGDRTAVVWRNDAAGVIGIARVRDDDQRSWRDYGPDWPPFVFNAG